MVSSNRILEQRNFLEVTLPHIWDHDLSDVYDEQLLETLRVACFPVGVPLRQQSFLALQRTNRALESKVQELLAELTTAKEQFCREKASDRQTQTELEKSLSLLQATLDSTEELLEAIAPRLEKHVGSKQWISEPQRLFPTCPQLKKVFDYIEANYHQSIGLSKVAVAVGYSAAYLTNLVRRKTGKTVNDWIFERRMLAARALLLETDQPVNQIACTIGYQYEGYFFRQFRQFHGTTPQVWRKTQRSNVSVNQ
ncbi:AraC family transcriptional regulator [Nostoc sp. LPT]|uniref:helix-turn-helix domain-containing protein n=1 Tax=Nostoc sp. LPT TaxID=2815387 RepID=UPI001D2702E7|nr:AraC family transcriptional regulator [Nostoc sp. LPT]MBN4000315.1 helix-turn-helix transcriptional regulator [Nostoc sp. LPT]